MNLDAEDPYATSYERLFDAVPGQLLFAEHIGILRLAAALLHEQDRVDDAIAGAASEQFGLERHELIWTALYSHLERCGYALPPRYAPGWRYTGPMVDGIHTRETRDMVRVRPVEDKHWAQYPDAKPLSIYHFLTPRATCIATGETVVLKILCSRPGHDNEHEREILELLNAQPLRRHPHNVCVPVREFLEFPPLPIASDFSLAVMPLLRTINLADIFDLRASLPIMKQALEGLVFLHSLGIAHRDIAMSNIVLDDGEVRPRVYFIDFGLAQRFDTPAATWKGGQIEPPEVRADGQVTYDPFKCDVYALAAVFPSFSFRTERRSVALSKFTEGSHCRDPKERFTAAEARDAFDCGLRSASAWYNFRTSRILKKLSRLYSNAMCRS